MIPESGSGMSVRKRTDKGKDPWRELVRGFEHEPGEHRPCVAGSLER